MCRSRPSFLKRFFAEAVVDALEGEHKGPDEVLVYSYFDTIYSLFLSRSEAV
jgi:hypothetical protein